MSFQRNYIYLLYNEKSNSIYVGKTFNLKKRISGHKTDSHRPKYPVSFWIKKLRENKQSFKVDILKVCAEKDSSFYEVFYIDYFKRLGFSLLNITKGGEGTSFKRSEVQRLAIKERAVKRYEDGFVLKLDARVKHSVNHIGNKHRLGLEPINKGKRKLNESQVAEIRSRFLSGENRKSLSAAFGVPIEAISSINKGRYFEIGYGYNTVERRKERKATDKFNGKDRKYSLYLFS